MLEVLMVRKPTATGGGGQQEDNKTDVSGLIAKYTGKGSISAVNVVVAPSGGIAIYNNQLIIISAGSISYYDINTFALIKTTTNSLTINVSYNAVAHQSGKHWWSGQDRTTAAIYHVDLETGAVTLYPTPPVKKGMFYAYKDKLWLLGGWVGTTSNNRTIYSIDIANPTAWTSRTLSADLPMQLHGSAAYFTTKGLVAFVGGGLSNAASTTDGAAYNTIMTMNPDSFEFGSIPAANMGGGYHNPNFIVKDTAYQIKYTNTGYRWPLGDTGPTGAITPAPTIGNFHNQFGLAGRVAFYGNSYNTAPVYLYVLPE